MTPYDSNRVLRYYNDIVYMKGTEDFGPMPQMVSPKMLLLYPSMTCNQKCAYCYYLDMHEPKAFMPTEKIIEVLTDSVELGVEGVELCGGGEPLLHPDIMEWANKGYNLGLRFGVLTHGALSPKKADLFRYIGQTFAYMRVSLDYANPDKYAETRGTTTKSFDWAINNIGHAIAARDEAKKSDETVDCKVSIKATVWKQEPQEIAELCYLGKRLGVDSIQFKKADEVDGGLNDERKRHNDIITVLEAMKYDAEMPPVLYNFGKIRLTHRCWITPIHVFVETDGDVHLCCYYESREESHRFGNVNKERLTKIWGSDAHKKAIMETNPDTCNNYACRFIKYMEQLDDAVENAQMEFI